MYPFIQFYPYTTTTTLLQKDYMIILNLFKNKYRSESPRECL